MISIALDKDIAKILSIFALSKGSRFNRNEILNKTKLNNVPLDNALSRLINSRILNKERNYYSMNFDNQDGKKIIEILSSQYKQLKEMPLEAYFSILEMVNILSTKKDIEVYLFGSYSKLIFKAGSDIDIAVLSDKKITANISKIEKKYGRSIEIHHFSKKEFYRNKKDPLVKDILKNGVKLI